MALILVATPDTRLAEILRAEVEGLGHESLWAVDGHEAVEAVEREPIALALLDSTLSIFDASEVCQMLRGNPDVPAALPLLLLTDEAVSPRQVAAVQASGVFPKTHGAPDLREVISRYLSRDAEA